MRVEVFPIVARERALSSYNDAVTKWPLQHTTLCEMRKARSGQLIGFRLQTAAHLVPLPHSREAFLVPIRHH